MLNGVRLREVNDELTAETTSVLQELVRFNTVNPPGNERPAIDYLAAYLREAGGELFELDGRRRYGLCCAEKGIFRFQLIARGAAGHASLPRTGENALLKLAPVLQRLADATQTFDMTESAAGLLRGLGQDPD